MFKIGAFFCFPNSQVDSQLGGHVWTLGDAEAPTESVAYLSLSSGRYAVPYPQERLWTSV